MTSITIFKNQEKRFLGFECYGHVEYADDGEDIICAGISALVISTINALGAYTDAEFEPDTDQETGLIRVIFSKPAGHDADLLMKSLILGLQAIQNNYGDEYIILNFREV